MIVHSFFLNCDKIDNQEDFIFIDEYSYVLSSKSKYAIEHPTIQNDDGCSKILYAFTNSKELKDLFMLTRNMDLFSYYKLNMDKKEYNAIKKSHSDVLLSKRDLKDTNSNRTKLVNIPMAITNFEMDKINDEIIIVQKLRELFGSDSISLLEYNLLRGKTKSLLNLIKLNDATNLARDVNSGANDSDVEFASNDYYIALQEFYDKMKIKTFEVFVDLFSITLMGKGV